MTTYFTHLDTPVGRLMLTSDGEALTGLFLPVAPDHGAGWLRTDTLPVLQTAVRQVQAYFDGALRDFDVPLRMAGTPFQKTVWDNLKRIPYGATISYSELARQTGNPKACRAVGLANGRNPIPIIVPCHRVIGANGSLTGYGGGLDCKQTLLAHELQVLGTLARRRA